MDILMVVLVMAAVTYLPRLIPMLFLDAERINPAVKRFLSYIPYAALGALIIPGGIGAVSGRPGVSIIALLVTIITAWFNRNIILTVAVSVVSVYLMLIAGFSF